MDEHDLTFHYSMLLHRLMFETGSAILAEVCKMGISFFVGCFNKEPKGL